MMGEGERDIDFRFEEHHKERVVEMAEAVCETTGAEFQIHEK